MWSGSYLGAKLFPFALAQVFTLSSRTRALVLLIVPIGFMGRTWAPPSFSYVAREKLPACGQHIPDYSPITFTVYLGESLVLQTSSI